MPFQRQPKAAPLLTVSPTAIAIGDDADSDLPISVTSSSVTSPECETFIAFDDHLSDQGDALASESKLESQFELSCTLQTYAQTLGAGSVLRARQPYFKGLSLLFFVILVHVCLFLLICILWRPQLNPFGLTETESRGPKVTALKAYFIYALAVEKAESAALETESKAEDKTEMTSSVTPTTVPTPPTQVKPLPIFEKVVPEKVDQGKVKPDTVKLDITQSSQSQSSAPSEVQPAEVTAKKLTNTLDTTEIKPQLGAKSSPTAEGESTIATSSSMSLFTQQYFERQREQELDDLVIEQADKFTRKSNMSEMSPEMEVLFVPNADDFGGTTSLDLPLDPNRIVRKGDTCYRVVQVGTQVNPYAENLGFPFGCSGKKINQAIDDAIQSQLNKMMLKPHK
ncbi:hypothetical protein [Shewanella vaxholmensis]|uniref:hypothetical protein n=1 Tax=Shewanella vaxholmensis TaxID=3063535 RepID=UPI00288FE44E|nr:hypothetical protein [Shewanella sp. SP1S1-4]MDT3308207.1 hypothetical protein [Shewanella sp. SP1S1-4]